MTRTLKRSAQWNGCAAMFVIAVTLSIGGHVVCCQVPGYSFELGA
ncbi:MAG TPA: hypothetical protein VF881_09980 [Polyangiaceae bacterium]